MFQITTTVYAKSPSLGTLGDVLEVTTAESPKARELAFQDSAHAHQVAERMDLGESMGASSGPRQIYSFERGHVAIEYTEIPDEVQSAIDAALALPATLADARRAVDTRKVQEAPVTLVNGLNAGDTVLATTRSSHPRTVRVHLDRAPWLNQHGHTVLHGEGGPVVVETPSVRKVIATALVKNPRSPNQVNAVVRTLNRKLAKLISWRGNPTTLYTLTAALEDGAIAIRMTEPDRSLTGKPDAILAETFLDVSQSAASLYRHGQVTYMTGMSVAINWVLKTNAIAVTYDGSGWWLVKGLDGVNLGRLRQGVTQAWTAWTLGGVRLQINGHDEYGGNARPALIARTMVTWPNY